MNPTAYRRPVTKTTERKIKNEAMVGVGEFVLHSG